jgi:hypothetical protein
MMICIEEWTFRHFYYMDFANASIHMAQVKFSPITFAMAKELDEGTYGPVSNETSILVNEVMTHVGQYELDTGR